MTPDEIYKTVKADIGRMAQEHLAGEELAAFLEFVDGFYPVQSPDDLLASGTPALFAIARTSFEASKCRPLGSPLVEFIPSVDRLGDGPAKISALLIVNDDMPFLVDSITGGLSTTLKVRIHMMHHPILRCRRSEKGERLALESSEGAPSQESFMYVEIDSQTEQTARDEITATLHNILSDVRLAVKDWRGMLAKIDETVASLTVHPPKIDNEIVEETIHFLRWLSADHFTFLGFREYRFEGDLASCDFGRVEGSGLGLLRDPKRFVLRDKDGLTPMSPEIRHFLMSADPLVITKANVRSSVHRPSHLDYVGVKIFNEKGEPIGERRFVGLFTSLSYSQFVDDVPVLRRKAAHVRARTRFDQKSHAGKVIDHILETFPRDELFQVGEDWLYETTLGVQQLSERPRPQVFVRPDPFERFVSALVYVPRDIYNSSLRQAVARILCEAYNGEVSVYYANLSEQALARWHFIIRTRPGEVKRGDPELINAQFAEAALGWADRLQVALIERVGDERGIALNQRYRRHFTVAYRDAFTPAQAAYDAEKLEELRETDKALTVDFYRHLADEAHAYRLKIYHRSQSVILSDCLPIFEKLGFRCLIEHTYRLNNKENSHIHDFILERRGVIEGDFADVKARVEQLFLKIWRGKAENDSFNELALTAGLEWQEIVVLRAYGKYLRQLGLNFTADYMAQSLVRHRAAGRLLFTLFEARFSLENKKSEKEKKALYGAIEQELQNLLDGVKSLDEDRIIRAYIHAIKASLRTNFYQPGVIDGVDERALAFKIRSREVEEAPKPRPFAEIWVYSPRLEGVHLRSGPVSRGGLRWSDRAEDFRTEVLGLVKAQQVKNAVIVPQGSKGGFYPKLLPQGDRDAIMQEGIASYRSFIASLLSLTDNLKGGKLLAPPETLRHDGDDPYLVVAADKGTASFSDIANSISQERGFWLGDAFASGGQHGYDHKKMAITARGAWVCVQRHFREMGVNTQTDRISVVGIGDMAGDVFGNGMLRSKTIALRAAFNHMHIFLDPNPEDLEKSFKERERLFNLPRSTWADYDAALISKGGGVFSRTEKTIKLSAPMRDWLQTEAESLAPNQLINLLLKAEMDLLWIGGIGTYVRAEAESDAQVGDRANDSLRITGRQLQAKVVGEGGNLGMTQKARIEVARLGGRLNTDFIDNSAGVDCSDKEVNIKILLSDAEENGALKRADRDKLLVKMTDEVAEIVLSDNYLQTQAISLAEAQASRARPYHLGLIKALERDGGLDRELENLPSDEGFAELAANDRGLTRPEIAIVMAYAKMSLVDTLLRGHLIDDPVLKDALEWGFPSLLRKDYALELGRHRLRREIVATVLANEIVNWGGLTFVYEIKEATGLAVEDIVAAFVVVREIYGLKARWQAINALDYKIPAQVQYEMHQSLSDSLKEQVLWMLRNLAQPFEVSKLVSRFKAPFKALFDIDAKLLSHAARDSFFGRRDGFKAAGVSHDLATFVAAFEILRQGADVIWVAEETGRSVPDVAEVYFALGDMLGHDWIRAQAARIVTNDHWDVLSVASELEELTDQQRGLALVLSKGGKGETAAKRLADWRETEKTRIIRAERLLEDLSSSGSLTVSKLSFATRHLRSIMR